MKPGKNQESELKQDGNEEDAELLSLSAEYSAALSIGNKPDLEALLAKVAPDRQASLLRHFQSLANVYAESGKESDPRDADAALSGERHSDDGTRLGTIADAKSQELVDSASMTQTGPGTAAFAAEQAPVKELGDYDLLGELGRGGMGVVYRARHRERGDVVALKILPHVDGESLHRFKREFRSLADISHPNLIGLRSLENEGQQWFFTMDLVENARSFRRFVRPNNELNLGRLKSSMLQLCEGLRKLHELDIIHRDLKPSNVVVDENGRVVILDFGLVTELNRNEQTKSIASVSGTPAYMSPEAAGGEGESFASDWYSVGVMLYQALSGKLPFEGDTLQILADKRAKDAPELDRPADVPAELASLCMALLSRIPNERPGLVDIQAACGAQTTANASQTSADRNILLGRDWHLAQLRSCFQSVSHTGKPSIVFVSGKSGEGKSALIEAFLAELRSTQEIAILSGRCYDRESVPFKALDSLIDVLVSYLRKLDLRKAVVLLPDDTPFLARLFPVLMRVEAVADRPMPDLSRLDEQQVRKRAFLALKELLRRLSQQVSIVMVCDDLQWGDADSSQVLADVLSGDGMPKLMFIGSFRSDEADSSPFLTRWYQHTAASGHDATEQSVEVAPLSLPECELLLQARFPAITAERAVSFSKELFEETGGNAFFVNEVLDCLQISGETLRRIPLSQVLVEKLSGLPEEASELMNTVAVSGQAMPVAELLSVAGKQSTSFSTLNAMRNLSLLRFVDEDDAGRIDTYHDKIRETVLDALGSNGKKPYHLRLATHIESVSDDLDHELVDSILTGNDTVHPDVERIYDLSFHFNAAEHTEKGAIYAFLAAEQARRQFSPGVAATQFELARKETMRGILEKLRPRWAEGLSDSYYWIGEYDKSLAIFESAREETMSDFQKAKLYNIACESSLALSRGRAALDLCFAGLKLLGIKPPTTRLRNLWASGLLLCRHIVRLGRPKIGRQAPNEEDRLLIRMLEKGMRLAMFIDGKYLIWFILGGIRQCERFSPTGEQAMLYGIYSNGASELGLQKHASHYTNRALEIAALSEDTYSVGVAEHFSGQSQFAQAKYQQACDTLANASKTLTHVGGFWFEHLVLLHRAQARFMLGHLRESLLDNLATFRRAATQKDMRTNCTAYLQCRISEGRFALEQIESKIVHNDEDVLSTCNLDKGYGIRQLHLGEFEEAVQHFERALDRPIKAMIPNWHVVAGYPYLVQALRLWADKIEATSPAEAKTHRARALKLARRSVWICWFFPTEYSFALREYGQVLADSGKFKMAEHYLKKSCQVSRKYDTPFELAKSELALADLGVLQERPDAQAERARAQAKLDEFHQQITDALAEIEPQL